MLFNSCKKAIVIVIEILRLQSYSSAISKAPNVVLQLFKAEVTRKVCHEGGCPDAAMSWKISISTSCPGRLGCHCLGVLQRGILSHLIQTAKFLTRRILTF